MRIQSWEYIAGFWDGEGTICIVRNAKGNLYPRIFVTNCDRHILVMIKRVTGGSIRKISAKRPKNWRTLHRLLIPTADIYWVLEQLIPHLVLKRPQAVLLLRALKGKLTFPQYQRMKKMNKRGR